MVENYKRYGTVGMRFVQVMCLAATVTGFIWATSDLLMVSVLANAPVTPLSVLMMLYGVLGSFLSEGIIRLLNRAQKHFLPKAN